MYINIQKPYMQIQIEFYKSKKIKGVLKKYKL